MEKTKMEKNKTVSSVEEMAAAVKAADKIAKVKKLDAAVTVRVGSDGGVTMMFVHEYFNVLGDIRVSFENKFKKNNFGQSTSDVEGLRRQGAWELKAKRALDVGKLYQLKAIVEVINFVNKSNDNVVYSRIRIEDPFTEVESGKDRKLRNMYCKNAKTAGGFDLIAKDYIAETIEKAVQEASPFL